MLVKFTDDMKLEGIVNTQEEWNFIQEELDDTDDLE